MSSLAEDVAAAQALVARTMAREGRKVIGVAGPPGAGKSTLAAALVTALNRDDPHQAALLPMDGFHLENEVLEPLGLLPFKGAPQTFDVGAFVALVSRLRDIGSDIAYPLFDRAADRTRPDAGLLAAGTPVVVVEGNYLLLRSGAWADLAPFFDATILIAPPVAELERRLVDRWLAHGLSPDQARARAQGNDLVNARQVLAESGAADLVLGEGPP